MNTVALSDQIRAKLYDDLRAKDPEVEIQVRRTTLGWIKLRIVTTGFTDQSLAEREEQIDDILTTLDLNLGSYPFADYELLIPEEAEESPSSQPVQLPLWSEILMAPEPDYTVPLEEDAAARPFVVTFYSFKGGVGRTTALGIVSGLLAARERRVVVIDFDLEAPGLSCMFPPESTSINGKDYGVLDYIHQRYLTPDQQVPAINDCIRRVNLSTRGELYLVPAGEYDEGYIHRLADLDIHILYQRAVNPVRRLLDDIKTQIDPDIILIDARTGFTEIGAVALFDLADLAIICFSPTDQSYAGLQWVVEAARKQRDYRGKPDLRFLLTPVPAIEDLRQKWTAQAEEWIAEHWNPPAAITINELYYQVYYNPGIAALTDLINNVSPELAEPYSPIADVIDASLPEIQRDTQIADKREAILGELTFQAAVAQELEAKDIPDIFQRTGDFTRFLHDRTWLIRGAKGTGKSLLFRLFVERPSDAKKLAGSSVDLANVHFIPAHGRAELRHTLLSSEALEDFEQQVGPSGWKRFWMNYALLRICSDLSDSQPLPDLDPDLMQLSTTQAPRQTEIVAWLVKRLQSPQAGSQTVDERKTVENWLRQSGQKVWLIYDELDTVFGQNRTRRRDALEGLFAWWIETGPGLQRVTPKILLREDIWSDLNFENKAHFAARQIQLRWDAEDLWRLVLRQILLSSRTMGSLLQDQFGIDRSRLHNLEESQLRRSLYPLWGERMGRGKKAYTHNWIRNRITDSQNNRFPRSLILLLREAVKLERAYHDRNTYNAILRPKALTDALPFVSEQRVDEVRNEYPEFDEYLNRLRNQNSPISVDQLSELWGKTNSELKVLVGSMIETGVLQEYTRPSEINATRYAVTELYLYGLGMKRRGQI